MRGMGTSEDAIARAFTARYAGKFHFDHDAGRWFQWVGTHWRRVATDLPLDHIRKIARAVGDGGRSVGKVSVSRGAETFAKADPAHAVTSADWDQNPWLLGTPGGTVNLETGILSPADPSDRISKITSFAPEPGKPLLWLKFLHEALADDEESIRFLRLWSGYCLTGLTLEQALLFLHGLSGTGKTVFLNTLYAIFGEYAVVAAMETFTASKNDRHSTELAMLRGARLVTASETEEGRKWAEARIKSLTGGDLITARFLYHDNFTFRPAFKLTIVGNHAPRLVNPDDAMRRRFNILGFNIKPAAPDFRLEEKLRAEHGRILAWAIKGCLEWRARGLVRPASVLSATDEYFAAEDLLGQWLEDRCIIEPGRWELPSRLFADWTKYAFERGEDPKTANSLGKKLSKLGFKSNASSGVRAWRGLALRSPDERCFDAQ
jgi:putative DNA primase/helicase